MEIQGKIKKIFDEQLISQSFIKREFVITTLDDYPQDVILEFTQDKCTLLNRFEVGQIVTVSYNIRGREWENQQGVVKYYNTLQAWRIK